MDKSQSSIHNNSFKYVLITAQSCALLPVNGVFKSVNELNFKWKSWKVYYTISIATILALFLIFEILYCMEYDINEIILSSMIHKLDSVFVLLQNLKLASKWPKLMKQWHQIDVIMNRRYGNLANFDLRIRILLGIYLISTIASYVDSLMFLEPNLIHNFYSHLFFYIPSNIVLGAFCLFVYTVHIFLSNFNDMFLIALSMALALRFKQIRNRLEQSEENNTVDYVGMSDFWLEMRRDYDRLAHLCKNLDNSINGLIFVSFAYNMFFVISYLFNQLMAENAQSQRNMFYFLFPYLVLRMFAVCLYTSWINDESMGPVTVLNSVPSRDYNPEIGRWLVQMSFDDVALTGGKIFKITRGIFLSVVSIVVTYELVVMQFHGFSSKSFNVDELGFRNYTQ